MSAANLIERAFSAFNAGDHTGIIACLAEDAALDTPGIGREIGREKIRWRLAALARHFRIQASDIAIMTGPGGLRAAAEFTIAGTYHQTLDTFPAARGQTLRFPAGIFLDIDDDGLISRATLCFDPASLRAALQKG